MINFTRALATKWGKYNIRVDAMPRLPQQDDGGHAQAWARKNSKAGAPLGRLGGDDLEGMGLCVLYASGCRQAHHWPVAGGGWGNERRSQAVELKYNLRVPVTCPLSEADREGARQRQDEFSASRAS